jgi:hypothetical protein
MHTYLVSINVTRRQSPQTEYRLYLQNRIILPKTCLLSHFGTTGFNTKCMSGDFNTAGPAENVGYICDDLLRTSTQRLQSKPQMRTHIFAYICISLFSCFHYLLDSFSLTRLFWNVSIFAVYHFWERQLRALAFHDVVHISMSRPKMEM